MCEPIGTSGTALTRDNLFAAIERMRNACPGCGGNGGIIGESFDHYRARVLTALSARGYYTLGEAMLRMKVCPSCDGTGQINPRSGSGE